jgi:hypothetical protein
VVLASDNLTHLPTPQLTTREQTFHRKHLPASYNSRPYTIIAFLFFGAFRFRVPRPSIENSFTPEFYSRCRESPVWSRVNQLHAVDRDTAGPEYYSTIVSLVLAKTTKTRVDSEVTRGDMPDTKLTAHLFQEKGIHPCRFETRDTSPITYHRQLDASMRTYVEFAKSRT